ncbi:MAG: hypothetical protein LBN71_02100 [Tannerella sp.]|jgi:hypothetical protein|nr:hypothetical protein [Tannerella sp.]
MKIEDVPQDSRYLEHTNVRDIYYATDEDGNYRQVTSVGWAPKNDALSMTWETISETAENIRKEVLAGEKSPLAYHIEMHLFNVGILSSYTGISRKLIKKHLQPEVFNRLDEATLEKYAEVMNITVEELKKV